MADNALTMRTPNWRAKVADKLDKETYRILNEVDVDAALKNVAMKGFIPDERQYAIAGIHKARLQTRRIWTRKQVQESTEWLRNNGFKLP